MVGLVVLPDGGLRPGPLLSGIVSCGCCWVVGTLPWALKSVPVPFALPLDALSGGDVAPAGGKGGGVVAVCANALATLEAIKSAVARYFILALHSSSGWGTPHLGGERLET